MYLNSSSSYYGLRAFIISLIYIFMLTPKTGAFKCFVCDSKNDIECTENLPQESKLVAQDCQNIIGAKYCIKTTNIYAGELGTKRFCSANDHGNYCRYIRQPTGDREYRSCVLTCNSESCNGSSRLIDGKTTSFATLALLMIMSYIFMT